MELSKYDWFNLGPILKVKFRRRKICNFVIQSNKVLSDCNMFVVMMADQPAPLRQYGSDVSDTRLSFFDHLEGLL